MGKRITIENAQLTLTMQGVAYGFPWVNSVVINDPRENILATSPQGHGNGIVYRQGTTAPINADFIVREVPAELFDVMVSAFEKQTRFDVLMYDKNIGDQYAMGDCIMRTNPSNVDVSEGEETFDVAMNTNCPASLFKHSPPADD